MPSAYMARWCNGYEVGLTTQRSRVRLLAARLLDNMLRQIINVCASVTKQYNLVPVKAR